MPMATATARADVGEGVRGLKGEGGKDGEGDEGSKGGKGDGNDKGGKGVPFFLVLFGSKFWIPEQKTARKNVSANQNGEGGGKWGSGFRT